MITVKLLFNSMYFHFFTHMYVEPTGNFSSCDEGKLSPCIYVSQDYSPRAILFRGSVSPCTHVLQGIAIWGYSSISCLNYVRFLLLLPDARLPLFLGIPLFDPFL